MLIGPDPISLFVIPIMIISFFVIPIYFLFSFGDEKRDDEEDEDEEF